MNSTFGFYDIWKKTFYPKNEVIQFIFMWIFLRLCFLEFFGPHRYDVILLGNIIRMVENRYVCVYLNGWKASYGRHAKINE